MLENLTKTQPDWHLPINRNSGILSDKLQLLADFTFDEANSVYIVTPRNIPAAVAGGLPHTLPDFFAVAGRMPNEYADGAAFRVGAVDFAPKYAGFEAGDVLQILFDRLENTCFFRRGGGGGGGSSLAAYAGAAYAGLSFVG